MDCLLESLSNGAVFFFLIYFLRWLDMYINSHGNMSFPCDYKYVKMTMFIGIATTSVDWESV